jgi:hypothetical protein
VKMSDAKPACQDTPRSEMYPQKNITVFQLSEFYQFKLKWANQRLFQRPREYRAS